MDLDRIKMELESCDFHDLLEVEKYLSALLNTAQVNLDRIFKNDGEEITREERFSTNLSGTLTRITNVRPGERKEYNITIENVSRKGMNFRVDKNFTPSQIVEINFASPAGKRKNCYMEIVRMNRRSNPDGKWLEVGSRSISKEQVSLLRHQEEQTGIIQSKLKNRTGIMIIAVGLQNNDNLNAISHLKSHDYQVRLMDSVHQAIQSAKKLSAQLILFCDGTRLCNDPELLAEAISCSEKIPTLAIVKTDEERLALLNVGIDEAMTVKNVNTFISHAIERALIGHSIRKKKSNRTTPRVLIVSKHKTRINMMTFYLDEKNYDCCATDDPNDATEFRQEHFDLVITDFSPENTDPFNDIQGHFHPTPIIALCEDISTGRQAIIHGACNYLCTPSNRDEVHSILKSTLLKKHPENW
ncbi:MAG: PilZ domain-containing protein [Phycisphaerae bacterium]|nr:PilZ domain-containing protein [Phycisphaerae bacterium]